MNEEKHQLFDVIEQFKDVRVLVVGDIILDEYIYGDVSRINPEAPVPVLNASNTEFRIGGAANVAHNIVKLGASCLLVGQVGCDDNKHILEDLLKKQNIDYRFLINKTYDTIKKTRIIARNQQVIRVDWEKPQPLTNSHIDRFLPTINLSLFDCIILSDYNKGTITSHLVHELKKRHQKIFVDPKPSNIEFYHDVHLIKPNFKEAKEITGKEHIEEIGTQLAQQYHTNVVITQGSKGASYFSKDGTLHFSIPTSAKEVYDVSGAGDTFMSTLALSLSTGANLHTAVVLANQSSSLVVGKIGTAFVTDLELLTTLHSSTNSKIQALPHMKHIINNLRQQNKKIVFTNGCFDILHPGHTTLLSKAKSFGDILILGLNSDDSVRKLKGPSRPINTETDRAEVLSHLSCVDYIVIFDEDTPCNLIGTLQPDIQVKGGDYDPQDFGQMPEAKIIDEYGGEIKIVPFIEDKSTTNIISMMDK